MSMPVCQLVQDAGGIVGGHEVQIFLIGEATYLMRKETANAIMPVRWPPLSETMAKVVAKRIPIFS
jgi:predicted peroxiredoxin